MGEESRRNRNAGGCYKVAQQAPDEAGSPRGRLLIGTASAGSAMDDQPPDETRMIKLINLRSTGAVNLAIARLRSPARCVRGGTRWSDLRAHRHSHGSSPWRTPARSVVCSSSRLLISHESLSRPGSTSTAFFSSCTISFHFVPDISLDASLADRDVEM